MSRFRGPRWRSPSLYWTFAGSFLLVLLAAAGVQAWSSVALVTTLEEQRATDRAELAVPEAVRRLTQMAERNPGPPQVPRVQRALHELLPPDLPLLLVYRLPGGELISDRPPPRALRRHVETLLDGRLLPQPGEGPPRRDEARPGGGEPTEEGWRNRPPRADVPEGPTGEAPWRGRPHGDYEAGDRPPRRPRPGGQRADGPPYRPPRLQRQPPPTPAPRPDVPRDPEAAGGPGVEEGSEDAGDSGNARVLRRQPLSTGGEVVAVLLHRRRGLWPLPAHSSLLLFAPVAILFAGSAGLIIFRLLLRRLRRLENLASRVAAGDLTARVDDLGDDEIGRLGSRLNRMTEALAQARERLETVDSQRRRLLADISHELATPLTSIRGYTETLLDPDVPTDGDERETFLRYVLAEAERMDLLIQDLFELTRLEAGTGALQREVLDWGLLCRHTLQRYEDRFRKAGLTLRWRGESIEVPVLADGRRLEQVLENLLTNALRYVPAPGTVEVSLIPARGHDGPCLEVADDGPGIPPAELPRIFDRFYRSQEVRGSRGTGLGLAIVQEVVSRHGGSVQALPREPRGVRFLIRLPAGP